MWYRIIKEERIKDLLQSRCWSKTVKEKSKWWVFQFNNEKEKFSMGETLGPLFYVYVGNRAMDGED